MRVTGEVIQQVFRIARGDATGAAFTVAHNGRQYLVTARHVADGCGELPLESTVPIEIFHGGHWKSIQANLVGALADPFDVAVLALPQLLGSYREVELGIRGLAYGQDVYFLGFPYGRSGRLGAINGMYPFPFIKHAYVSMICSTDSGEDLITLDGLNNPGFSGGPVIFQHGERASNWSICGVVLNAQHVPEPVTGSANQDENADLRFEANIGLIDVCPAHKVVELLNANPIGFPFDP